MSKTKNYIQYTQTSYSGRKLLEEHSLEEYGFWKILGEDPNCDLGGSHHQPDLGTVEGKLGDIIDYAVELPGFWQWGGGGDIIKQDRPLKITPETLAERKSLEAEEKILVARLAQIRAGLGKKS